MTLGDKIRNARNKENISQKEIAGYLGLTQRAYSKIENNEVQLKIERLEEIAKLLNTNASELLAKDNGQYFENVQNSQIGNNNTMNNFNSTNEELLELIKRKEIEIDELQEILKKRE